MYSINAAIKQVGPIYLRLFWKGEGVGGYLYYSKIIMINYVSRVILNGKKIKLHSPLILANRLILVCAL